MVNFFDLTLPDCKNELSCFVGVVIANKVRLQGKRLREGFFFSDVTYVSFYLPRVITGVISFFLGVSRIHDRQGQPKKKC